MPFSTDTTVTIIADDKAAPYRKICYVGLVLISLPESHVKSVILTTRSQPATWIVYILWLLKKMSVCITKSL